ncbi:MAG: B12-binding domain-containing radical SAM protein [Tabrizicola sp.]|nr:B12-binding domain-containing radical SAM protein [Tabrizicola sp.]
MHVALISPKGPLYRHRGGIFRKSLRYQPLTLTTLAALAPGELGIRFTLIDEGIEEIPADLQADLIGMTVITGTAPRSYHLAQQFRARGIKVVLGGPHVTLMPDEAAAHADAICVGYAEKTWPELLRDHARGALKPRYTQAADFALDELVIPQRHLLDRRRFITQAVFEATRSCAHPCEFCTAPAAWGRKQFQKPVEHVVADIRSVGARRNIFIDLNLISDRDYARRLFTALIPLRIRWFGLVTALIGTDPGLMALMAESGCSGVLIGFESVSGKSLGGIRKGFNRPDHFARLIADLHRHKISIFGCFVFGLDEDTPDVFEATARFVIDHGIDLPRFAISTPFPGTPLYHRLEAAGRILTRDWELYDGQHVVFQPQNMSAETLLRGHEWAWKEVYSRWNIARRLMTSRVQLPVSLMANAGYRYYANHLHTHYNCDWIIGQRERPEAA